MIDAMEPYISILILVTLTLIQDHTVDKGKHFHTNYLTNFSFNYDGIWYALRLVDLMKFISSDLYAREKNPNQVIKNNTYTHTHTLEHLHLMLAYSDKFTKHKKNF